jgi:hypothetical protein
MVLRPIVEIEIAELVVDGLDAAAAPRFTNAFRDELHRLIASPSIASAWRTPAAAAISAPLIQATRPRLTLDRPAAAGIEAARGLVEGLKR